MPSLQLRIEMSPGSSGKTLFIGSASRDQLYRIMGRSLTVGFIEIFAKNSKYETYTPPPGIPKEMTKLKPPTKPY